MNSASRIFPEKIGFSPHYGSHSCNCCPYGYHIDLDFVRYCEELANANPSESEMQRRQNRRSRKSMEFMLGLENLTLDEWDQIREPGESNLASSSPLAAYDMSLAPNKVNKTFETRPRSASVPRFSFNTSTARPDSPFGTASSTCSSRLGAESDVPFSLYQRRQRKYQQHSADTFPAFVRDALDDVCSDFERTLERASVRRKKNPHFEGGVKSNDAGFDNNNNSNNCSSYSYRQTNFTSHENRTFSKWERQFDFLDSCVAGNKSPRSSRILSRSNTLPYIVQQKPTEAELKYELYVKANVAANSNIPVDVQVQTPTQAAPPPPPRRHTLNRQCSPVQNQEIAFPKALYNVEKEKNTQNAVIKETPSTTDAQTLQNMRQQMAVSLSRLRDLEEQVKTIPELKLELQQLREEKRRLELNRPTSRETTMRISESPSPKIASPVQFTPQHINSISLESLGARLRTSSTSSNSERQKFRTVMKRDVGTNCNRAAKRDVAVGSPIFSTRSVSTEPQQKLYISDELYTQGQMEECVKNALKKHKEQRLLNMTTKATQMLTPGNNSRHTGSQTNDMPLTQDNAVMCKPNMRSVASSDHRITDIYCEKCTVKKCNIACGTHDDEDSKKYWVSLKTLDTPYTRSNTFSLGEQERLNLLVRKSVGTQYISQALVNAFSQTTAKHFQSVGVQNSISQQNTHTQTFVGQLHQETDTKDLIKLCIRETSCEAITGDTESKETVPKIPIINHNKACNTEIVRTRDKGDNTTVAVSHSGSNTENVSKRDVGCGDIVKPHISIACAENYCDSCKDAIKNLAKDFSKGQPLLSPLATRANESRIPRPKHLSSPSPVRKQIYRQNTYTITPSPTPSPVAEKKLMSSSLSGSFLKQRSATEIKSSELNKRFGRKSAVSKSSETVETKTRQGAEKHTETKTDDSSLNEPLIVREEKRVSICWSREASPLSPQIDNSESKSLQVSLSEDVSESKTSQSQDKEDKLYTLTQKSVPIYEPSSEVHLAMKMLNDSLLKKMNTKSLSSNSLQSAKSTVQQEWFHISSTEHANLADVQAFFNCVEKMSLQLLEYCVNLRDNNGNTALHYAVSHGNFDIVSILLDSKVCDVNQMNNAGYTCVMLVSLAKLKDTRHCAVVERLFNMADINIRAKKHCQTALMLAVSHGNLDMVKMLLAAGADINVQDEDGSTALMCAAEHGRIDIVKHLLSHSDCDSLIQDVDCSTAFKIAWQGGYRDIGLLLYVHEQMLRSKMPHRSEQPKTPTSLPHADKQNPTSK